MYDLDRFREFCIAAGATKLFDSIWGSIHPLQIDHALYLRSNQINHEGIETEHIMGHTCSRRTVNNVLYTISESHFKSFEEFITEATERKGLIVLIIDDFTAIHTTKKPQEDKSLEAKTMCTIVVKAFKDNPAVSIKQALCIHDKHGIDMESCQGLVTADIHARH